MFSQNSNRMPHKSCLFAIVGALSLVITVRTQDIEWFQTTPVHQINVQQINDPWTECHGHRNNTNDTLFTATASCVMITLQVPLNWDDPGNFNDTVDYHISRVYDASDLSNTNNRRAFWMLIGGPGQPGSLYYAFSTPWMQFLNNAFDLYLPDHRGTGRSNPLHCQTDELSDDAAAVLACNEQLTSLYGDDLQHFSTYAASMDLGYVIDLLQSNLSRVYRTTDDVVYGVSYGTHWLNQYLFLFPNQTDAAIYDSIIAPDLGLFSQYDNDTNRAGVEFLRRCETDAFCDAAFSGLGVTALEATKFVFDALLNMETNDTDNVYGNECLQMLYDAGGSAAAMRVSLGKDHMMNDYMRPLVHPIIYRLYRCSTADVSAFEHLLSLSPLPSQPSEMALGLLYHVAVSDMWPWTNESDSGPTYEEFLEQEEQYYFSAGLTPDLRQLWDIWNRYIPKQDVWRRFADISLPVLMMSGDLDAQTHISQGLHMAQYYEANIDDTIVVNPNQRYFVTFPNVAHGVLETSFIQNESSFTCGMYVVRSFVDLERNYLPDTSCIAQLVEIDWTASSGVSQYISLYLFDTDDAWSLSNTSDFNFTTTDVAPTTTDVADTQPTDQTTTPESQIWFIVAIVFIVLFGVAVLVIAFLWYLSCSKDKSGEYHRAEQNDIELQTGDMAER